MRIGRLEIIWHGRKRVDRIRRSVVGTELRNAEEKHYDEELRRRIEKHCPGAFIIPSPLPDEAIARLLRSRPLFVRKE